MKQTGLLKGAGRTMEARDGLALRSKVAGLIAGGLLASGVCGVAVQAAQASAGEGVGAAPDEPDKSEKFGPVAQTVRLAASEVHGKFEFVQDTVDSNEQVREAFLKADASLCHLPAAQRGVAAHSARIAVGGSSVARAVVATVDELKALCGETTQVLTCACTANPAAGSSIATAEVRGVSLADLAAQAGIDTSCFGAAWDEQGA